jgi:hypothetical protein
MHLSNPLSRRTLFSMLPAGAAACTGCLAALRCAAAQESAPAPAHTPDEKADMSWEAIFRFAYQRSHIPILKAIGSQIGQEKLIGILKESTSQFARDGMTKHQGPRDFSVFVGRMKAGNPMYDHALVYKIVEDTPQALELRITRCLWAKTFRDENAADIGYASVCHPDFAVASAFSPKMKLIRTKTLMQGDDHCNHRWIVES